MKDLFVKYLSLDHYINYEQFNVYCTLMALWLKKMISLTYQDHYKSLAYLLVLSMSISDIKRCLQLKSIENMDYLIALIKSRRFCGFSLDSYPVGISTLRGLTSMQEELNVKRIKTKDNINVDENFKIIPQINVTIPSNYDGYTWFRLKVQDIKKATITYSQLKNIISDNYIELYLNAPKKKELKEMLDVLNSDDNVIRIVFCSNLRFVKTLNLPVAFANIFSYLFCYLTQSDDVYLSLDVMPKIYYYQQLAFLFLYANNLNNIRTDSPLSVLASERNISLINNYKGLYSIESNRCNNVMSNYINLGPYSNNDLIINYVPDDNVKAELFKYN